MSLRSSSLIFFRKHNANFKNENQRQFILIYCVFHIYALLYASLAIHKRKVCLKFKKRKSKLKCKKKFLI